jgi:SAM-dependent methyltransferase
MILPLTSEKWAQAIIRDLSLEDIIKRLNSSDYNTWSEPLLRNTKPGQSVLELGSGTGELSAVLAKNGRGTTLLDYSENCLKFSKRLFETANLKGTHIMADVLKPLPFADNTFDCVWSSGLLEHFNDEQIISILQESKRVSKNKVISLVPNAYSLAYRIGKWYQEYKGLWPWGKEEPKFSMESYFKNAGFSNVTEFFIDFKHSTSFLTSLKPRPIQFVLVNIFKIIPDFILNKTKQGYLLVTIGEII